MNADAKLSESLFVFRSLSIQQKTDPLVLARERPTTHHNSDSPISMLIAIPNQCGAVLTNEANNPSSTVLDPQMNQKSYLCI